MSKAKKDEHNQSEITLRVGVYNQSKCTTEDSNIWVDVHNKGKITLLYLLKIAIWVVVHYQGKIKLLSTKDRNIAA